MHIWKNAQRLPICAQEVAVSRITSRVLICFENGLENKNRANQGFFDHE